MTEGRQPFTAEIKTLAKGPSTYDPLENNIDVKLPFKITTLYASRLLHGARNLAWARWPRRIS
jgi:hypothetical protein